MEDTRAQIKLLAQAANGKFTGLSCPGCHQQSVNVWFSQPIPEEYRTWLICDNCEFFTRAHNSARPPYFSSERIKTDLEAHDYFVLRKARFKVPDEN